MGVHTKGREFSPSAGRNRRGLKTQIEREKKTLGGGRVTYRKTYWRETARSFFVTFINKLPFPFLLPLPASSAGSEKIHRNQKNNERTMRKL